MKSRKGEWPAIFPQAEPALDFKEYFNRFYPAVCRHLTSILGDRDLAQDIAQEVFVKLYLSPPRDDLKVGAWLFKVATNTAYNFLRSEKSRTLREFHAQPEDEGASSEEIVIRKEEMKMVHRVLDGLEERDRTCLIMKFSGFRYDEIAQVLGVKKSSVGTIIARAQARFRDKILEFRGSDLHVF